MGTALRPVDRIRTTRLATEYPDRDTWIDADAVFADLPAAPTSPSSHPEPLLGRASTDPTAPSGGVTSFVTRNGVNRWGFRHPVGAAV
jgi:hypothetical protein